MMQHIFFNTITLLVLTFLFFLKQTSLSIKFFFLKSSFRWNVYQNIKYLKNNIISFHGVGAGEWGCASEKFKHEDSERPVVSRDVVTLVQDNLWSYVLGGTTEGPGLAPNLNSFIIIISFLNRLLL